jgi:NADH-quinone oxidoreductase subunit J
VSTLLFYGFGGLALGAGALAVSRKNAVAAVVWLVVMFFGLAGIYVLLQAWFVAVVQVLIYAGAIMVLFLFVIMLLDLRSRQLEALPGPRLGRLGIVAALGFFGLAAFAVLRQGPEAYAPGADLDGGAGSIGKALFEEWLLAFELTSLLLLAAIVGAVILTKRRLS